MTDHQRLEGLLTDFASGSLRSSEHDEMNAHVEACLDCRQWVETYRGLAAVVMSPPGLEPSHPETSELARYAVDRAGLSEKEQARVVRHLAACTSCSQDVELTEGAVASAREVSGNFATETFAVWARALRFGLAGGRPRRLALAATVLIAIVTSLFVLSPWRSSGGDLEISSRSFTGNKLVEAEGTITATAVVIETRSTVDFRGGDSVVLGNGFSVADGASFSVELTGNYAENSEREQAID